MPRKRKRTVSGFPFPKDIVAEIGSFLYGRDLLNFKLVSKTANEVSKERSCYVKITSDNYRKDIDTLGIHVIIVKKDNECFFDIFRDLCNDTWQINAPKIQELIIDFKDYPEEKTYEYMILCYIRDLKELKRCKIVNANIPSGGQILIDIKEDSKLEDLEIHSLGAINLWVHKKIKKVRIYQTNEYATVSITATKSTFIKHYQYDVKGKLLIF